LGVYLSANDQTIPFALNNSLVKNSWRDLRMQARFGWFYPSLAVSMSETKVHRDTTEIADLYGTGYGGGLGFYAPLTATLILHADSLVIKPQTNRDSSGNSAETGTRTEADFGASFSAIPLYLDLLCGYKYRQFSLSSNDEEFIETQSAPYVGIQIGAYF